MTDGFQTRWEASGNQGHDSVSISPPRPDYEHRASVHRNHQALVQLIDDAERQLCAAYEKLDAWMHSEVILSSAIREYDEKLQGFRKLVSFIVYRQERQSIKAFRIERDQHIVGGDMKVRLSDIEDELRGHFESLSKSLDDWDGIISEAEHWQGVGYWNKCRWEAIDESESRHAALDEFRDRIQDWRTAFATWSAQFRGASTASEPQRERKPS